MQFLCISFPRVADRNKFESAYPSEAYRILNAANAKQDLIAFLGILAESF